MPKHTDPYKFEGFSSPSTTPVPDVMFDELLLLLDNNELRVLLYIIRRTYGFKKESDNISLSQMVGGLRKRDGTMLDRGTGLSKASVARGLKGLIDKNIIVSRRNRSDVRGDEPTTYALRFKEVPSKPDSGSGDDPCLSTEIGGVSEVITPVSQSRDTQQTGLQQTVSSSNIRKASPTVSDHNVVRPAVPAARPTRGGQPETIGAVITRQHQLPMAVDDMEARSAIEAYLRDFARELGDTAPIRSTVTRAVNVYKSSGLALPVFINELYIARAAVKDVADGRIRGTDKAPIRNRMSYFFSVLTDQVNGKELAKT
jgi:hypothetical protein